MKKYIFLILLVFLGSLHATYILRAGNRPKSAIDKLPFHSVLDMKRVPQNTSYYSKQIKSMSWRKQKDYDKKYNERYFAPWYIQNMGEPKADLSWQIRMVQKRKIYAYSRRIISSKVWKWWIKNSNFKNIDMIKGKAISIKHANLRAFPTDTPAYRDPWKSTEGFPFDYNQNSELHINVPLYVSHYSLDKKWAFVHAGHAFGWVKRSSIAKVTAKFIKQFKTKIYSITIKDDIFLYKDKKKISIIKLGTIFPLSSNKKLLLVAQKSKSGYAIAKKIKRPSEKLVMQKPIKFNRENVSSISQEFYNEPYGWGGKMYTRDCSATTRDFFACFGIYLDRNSAKQSKSGKLIKIKGLKKEEKKELIVKYAKPFASMLYVPGHIGIYLGVYKDEPIIMHTYWGIRLNDWSKYTLARTIITTTEPGKELLNIRENSKLINTLKYIINF